MFILDSRLSSSERVISNTNWGVMSSNQRQYFRCPLAHEDSSAVLVFRWRSIQCRLIEMSIGGFAVLAPASCRLPVESLIHLKVRGLEYIVRLTRQETRDDGTLLGLEQVEEVVPDRTLHPSTLVGRWLTKAAWAAAVGTLAVAAYCLSGLHTTITL
jgi:hypothetical protein